MKLSTSRSACLLAVDFANNQEQVGNVSTFLPSLSAETSQSQCKSNDGKEMKLADW